MAPPRPTSRRDFLASALAAGTLGVAAEGFTFAAPADQPQPAAEQGGKASTGGDVMSRLNAKELKGIWAAAPMAWDHRFRFDEEAYAKGV